MKRWRRPLILIVLLLLAGAGVNVAVAWAVVGRCTLSDLRRTSEPLPAFFVQELEPGSILEATQLRSVRWRCLPPAPGGVWDIEEALWYDTGIKCRGALAAGWPLLALRCSYDPGGLRPAAAFDRRVRTPARGRLGGLGASDWLVKRGWFVVTDGRIPLDPLPAGLFLNTLFYASILGLPLSFFPIRRRLRARRGRCPKCGYDLTGLSEVAAACPECGAAR